MIPRVLGVAYRASATAHDVAATSLMSVTDNPAFVFDELADGEDRVFSTGGYHNGQAGRAIDLLTMAYADLSVLCAKQTNKLLDGNISGVSPLLVRPDRPLVGTEFLAWMQTDFAERARHSAQPTLLTLGLEDPQGGQSDVATTCFAAYERFLTSTDTLNSSLAILSWVCHEALHLSGRSVAPALQPFHQDVATMIQPQVTDYGKQLAELQTVFIEQLYR